MELTTINKLYLELSQIATAKTKREIELEQALHLAQQPPEWIKCADALPSHPKGESKKGCVYVLCHVNNHKRARAFCYYAGVKDRWYDEDGRLFKGEVLAWMRLPAVPHGGTAPVNWKY